MDIVQPKQKSLSEEFLSRSPNSQFIIKSVAQSTPTSKFKNEYSNLDKYNDLNTSSEEKEFMINQGLVSLNSSTGCVK